MYRFLLSVIMLFGLTYCAEQHYDEDGEYDEEAALTRKSKSYSKHDTLSNRIAVIRNNAANRSAMNRRR